jgi:HEPN domain-containing protein
MPRDSSVYSAEWMRIAEKDWNRARRLLAAQDAEAAGFHLQQSVEKFLKGFLLLKGWKLKRTHDLEALLDAAVVYDGALAQFRSVCQEISNCYLVERYPGPQASGPSLADVEASFQAVSELIDKLR